MADFMLKRIDPMVKEERKKKEHNIPSPERSKQCTRVNARYIPIPIKREIWKKHGHQCSYEDPATGRRCGARHFLEINGMDPPWFTKRLQ
jgi:hypothetical protein